MTPELLHLVSIHAVLLFSMMVILWIINILWKNMGIVDIGWSLGFLLIATTSMFLTHTTTTTTTPTTKKMLFYALIFCWSMRLTLYLTYRFAKHAQEDRRYAKLRKSWTHLTELKIFAMFLFQAFLILILSLPFTFIALDPNPYLTSLEIFGALLILIGIVGESLADYQLWSFKNKHPKQLCRQGLWNHSRHPNYFFEWVVWIGIALFALPSPGGLTGIVSCALMLYLLLFVSGIYMTESSLLETKGPEYINYQKQVPGFIPRIFS